VSFRLQQFAAVLAWIQGWALAAAVPGVHPEFAQSAEPFLQTHCYRCHGEKKQKAELRLDTLARDFAGGNAATRWSDVLDRIKGAEMPPDDEPQPKAEEASKIVEWLALRLSEGEATRLALRERVTLHKLTREEYTYTIFDLLGVNYDATDPTGLLEDPDWHGFERIGSVLSLSPAHVEKYFTAAESVLAEALPRETPKKTFVHWDAQALQPKTNVQNPPGPGRIPRVVVWPGSPFCRGRVSSSGDRDGAGLLYKTRGTRNADR